MTTPQRPAFTLRIDGAIQNIRLDFPPHGSSPELVALRTEIAIEQIHQAIRLNYGHQPPVADPSVPQQADTGTLDVLWQFAECSPVSTSPTPQNGSDDAAPSPNDAPATPPPFVVPAHRTKTEDALAPHRTPVGQTESVPIVIPTDDPWLPCPDGTVPALQRKEGLTYWHLGLDAEAEFYALVSYDPETGYPKWMGPKKNHKRQYQFATYKTIVRDTKGNRRKAVLSPVMVYALAEGWTADVRETTTRTGATLYRYPPFKRRPCKHGSNCLITECYATSAWRPPSSSPGGQAHGNPPDAPNPAGTPCSQTAIPDTAYEYYGYPDTPDALT